MSRQNIYDHAEFHRGYVELRRARSGYNDRLEQPAVNSLLPDLAGLVIVDLGCGSGEHTRRYAQAGASRVHGVDPSERMLEAASPHPAVTYHQAFAEEIDFGDATIDLVVASMSLHYVADLRACAARIARWLRPGGALVASMEHPIATATGQWCDQGHRIVADYSTPGPRSTTWFVDGVIKYHRSFSDIWAALRDAELHIDGLLEPVPSAEDLVAQPGLEHAVGSPPILVISARHFS